jgi:DNA-binding beta-propeller fold protein YncE
MTRRAGAAALFCLIAAGCDESAKTPELRWSLAEDQFWPDLRTYPGVGAGRIVVTNNLDDTVSILDLSKVASDDLSVIATVPVGLNPVEREGPHHVATDPRGDYYYVGISNYVPGSGSGPHGNHGSGTADGHALKIRASDNVQVASLRVDRSPGDIRMTPDGRLLLMSHFDLLRITEVFQQGGDKSEMDSNLAIIDPATMTRLASVRLCPAAHGIAVSPDSKTAYVSCIDDSMVVVDLASSDHPTTKIAVIDPPGPVSTPLCYPYAMTISPSGKSVWVSCFVSGQVHRFDTESGTMDTAHVVQLLGPAAFGTFTADGTTLIVPHQGNGVAFIDPIGGTVLYDVNFTSDVCTRPHTVRLTGDEARLMIVCEGDHVGPGSFVVLDVASRTVERTVVLGRFPDDIGLLRRP